MDHLLNDPSIDPGPPFHSIHLSAPLALACLDITVRQRQRRPMFLLPSHHPCLPCLMPPPFSSGRVAHPAKPVPQVPQHL